MIAVLQEERSSLKSRLWTRECNGTKREDAAATPRSYRIGTVGGRGSKTGRCGTCRPTFRLPLLRASQVLRRHKGQNTYSNRYHLSSGDTRCTSAFRRCVGRRTTNIHTETYPINGRANRWNMAARVDLRGGHQGRRD